MNLFRFFKNTAIIFATSIMMMSGVSHATPLEPLAFYARCYGHLTGRALPLNSPLRAGLKNGSIDPLVACKTLLDKGNLDPTSHQVNTSDPEALHVIQQMVLMHRSWFNATDFTQMSGYEQNGTMDMFDPSEPALALTSILFQQGAQAEEYRQVFKESHGYYPIRVNDPVENAREYYHQTTPLPSRIEGEYGAGHNSLPWISFRKTGVMWAGDGTGSNTLVITPIYNGEVTGIQWDNRTGLFTDYDPMIIYYFVIRYSYATYGESATLSQMVAPIGAFQRNGGGVLGSPVNMMLNWGQPPGQVVDGALKMPRRWIKNTMEAMLCKQFPTLRESDVLQFVDNSTVANKAPFRASSTCVQCHATFDNLAAVGRNFLVGATDYAANIDPISGFNIKDAHIMAKSTQLYPDSGKWSSTPVTNYRNQAPAGRIYFRDFSGKLIDQQVTGIQAAGDVLAETDDLYQCAAKRYFKYFTGLDVPLYDRGDVRYADTLSKITSKERNLRIYIEKLAADFKNHQSSKKLIQTILSSDYYRDSNNMPAGN
jgi:hypothetical protein